MIWSDMHFSNLYSLKRSFKKLREKEIKPCCTVTQWKRSCKPYAVCYSIRLMRPVWTVLPPQTRARARFSPCCTVCSIWRQNFRALRTSCVWPRRERGRPMRKCRGWSGWWRCYGRKWALAVSGKSSDWLAVGRPEQTATSGDQAAAFNSEQTAEAWPGQTQAGSGVLSLSPVLIPAQAQKCHRKCLTTFSLQSPMKLLLPALYLHTLISYSKGFLSFILSLLTVDFYLQCDIKSG